LLSRRRRRQQRAPFSRSGRLLFWHQEGSASCHLQFLSRSGWESGDGTRSTRSEKGKYKENYTYEQATQKYARLGRVQAQLKQESLYKEQQLHHQRPERQLQLMQIDATLAPAAAAPDAK
jgi:hypothetical protein